MMVLIAMLALGQATSTIIVDPAVQSKRAKVTTTAGGALQVECVGGTCSGGGAGSSGDGGYSTTYVVGTPGVYVMDAGVLLALVSDGTGPLTVDGTLTCNAGSGTLAVSGPLTDAQLRASVVPVSLTSTTITGTVAATQSGAWSLSANQSVNVAQLAGTTTDTNSGSKSAGTLRVVLATDQPALTNKLLVTPDSVALPANQSVNTAQFGGTNVSTGTGASGAGIPRVTISNDSSLAANQSVNLAQVAGSTTTTGNGTAAGSIRVSVASDSTGTIAATQSGTWTVQPGNTANSTPWLTTDTPRTVSSANNTGTCVSVTANTTVLASNGSRRAYGFKAHNNNTALVHCKLGATATTSNTSFNKGDAWGQDTGAVYTGIIDCIAASGTQTVCAYEFN